MIASPRQVTDPADWLAANQRLLTFEFRRFGGLLEAANGDDGPAIAAIDPELASARADMAGSAAIDRVAEAFELSQFERDLLLLAAAVELDASVAASCAARTGGPWLTFGAALAALPQGHWSAVTPARPLRRWRLVDLERTRPLTQAPLAIDERILHEIVGVDDLDHRLVAMMTRAPERALMSEEHRQAARETAARWASTEDGLVVLEGDDRDGQIDVAELAARHLGRELFVMAWTEATRARSEELNLLWSRETALTSRALFIDCHSGGGDCPTDMAPAILGSPGSLGVVPSAPRIRVSRPSVADRRLLWAEALPVGSGARRSIDALASVPLSAAAIMDAAAGLAREHHMPEARWMELASRMRPPSPLDDLAERIDPTARLDDLIVPADVIDQLKAITAQYRGRDKVYENWGFAAQSGRGLGVTALFTGESGTGKTMAAEVLAAELGIELYRVELSAVISKYIGETEKNLERVFVAAQSANVLLLFDESDALFGKRSEVRDSHDRYANVETAYLLQRMESYKGLAILTTNARPSLDRAFTRRLRFIVNFPFPDADLRAQLWRRAFPRSAPTARLDFKRLARLNIAGGSIRTIALNASFEAAAAGTRIGMGNVLRAAVLEGAKRERAIGAIHDQVVR
jgi:hypothetical protein